MAQHLLLDRPDDEIAQRGRQAIRHSEVAANHLDVVGARWLDRAAGEADEVVVELRGREVEVTQLADAGQAVVRAAAVADLEPAPRRAGVAARRRTQRLGAAHAP